MRTNFVGRSFVSAMTHTPASGPFGPVTTPPMSSGPTFTAASDVGSAAAASVTHAAARAAMASLLRVITRPPRARSSWMSALHQKMRHHFVDAPAVDCVGRGSPLTGAPGGPGHHQTGKQAETYPLHERGEVEANGDES